MKSISTAASEPVNAYPLTHEQRTALYVKILRDQAPPLNEFTVGYMRAKAPNQKALDALNAALIQVGWKDGK